jgi:cytidylate kinase
VESGALYRAVALAGLDAGVPLDGQRLVALARSLPVRLALAADGFHPEVAGVDVSAAVRERRVAARVSEVAAIAEVRDWVNEEVRTAVAVHPRGAVLDGRDIGTVVFPDAALKVFLIARPEERARRRILQEGRTPTDGAVREAAEAIARRDALDSGRTVAPLRQAADAVVIDTSDMAFEEQVRLIVRWARKAFAQLDIAL